MRTCSDVPELAPSWFLTWKMLKEKFDILRIIGNVLVVIGVIIFNLR